MIIITENIIFFIIKILLVHLTGFPAFLLLITRFLAGSSCEKTSPADIRETAGTSRLCRFVHPVSWQSRVIIAFFIVIESSSMFLASRRIRQFGPRAIKGTSLWSSTQICVTIKRVSSGGAFIDQKNYKFININTICILYIY